MAEAQPMVARTRAELDALLDRIGDAGGVLRVLEERRRQLDRTEERLAHADTLMSDVRVALETLLSQRPRWTTSWRRRPRFRWKPGGLKGCWRRCGKSAGSPIGSRCRSPIFGVRTRFRPEALRRLSRPLPIRGLLGTFRCRQPLDRFMDSAALRALQAPIKNRYREDPATALVTSRAAGGLIPGAIEIAVDAGGRGERGATPGHRRQRQAPLLG